MSYFSSDVDLGGESRDPANNIVPFARGLDGISKMINDRNKLIKFYFKEDVYKDFLLAERLQDIADADNARERSQTTESINLDKQEVDKTQNYFRRFSNFLNPGDLPSPDLDPLIFSDDVNLDRPEEVGDDDEEDDEEDHKGGILDTLLDLVGIRKGKGKNSGGGTTKSAYGNTITPRSPIGGSVNTMNFGGPSISSNMLTPPEDRPQVESLKESGFEEGMKKNISDKFNDDFGIDSKMKDALGLAMAAPLQVVAGGLMRLMSLEPVKSNEQKNDLMKSLSFISNAFGIPASTLENVPDDPALLQSGDNSNRPTPASSPRSGGSMRGNQPGRSGNNFQWWNPFTWFGGNQQQQQNTNNPPITGNGSLAVTSGPITNTTNMMGGNRNTTMNASSSSVSSFSPKTMATNLVTKGGTSLKTENVQETVLGDSNTDIFQTLFGGTKSLVSNIFSGSDGHIHTVEISRAESPVQDKRPDLMSLTTKLETELMQRREEQTTSVTQSIASSNSSAMSPARVPAVSQNSLNTGSNRAGSEETESPFFSVFASTNQF